MWHPPAGRHTAASLLAPFIPKEIHHQPPCACRRISVMFNPEELSIVNNAIAMAEELVSNHFKMSTNQWLRLKYDVKTLATLSPGEIVAEPFAQIIRYEGKQEGKELGSAAYDFYKICLQDRNILKALARAPGLTLFPFILYIITHELVHVVRFHTFLQNFDASPEERLAEEARVHAITHLILNPVRSADLSPVLTYFKEWRKPFEGLATP